MYERTTVIVISTGLHARPAATFIKCSKGFSSEITIRNLSVDPPQEGNAKSMLGVLKLAMTKGVKVSICAQGDDEQVAVDTLIDLIDSGFDEE